MTTSRPRAIINADDLGMSPVVNDAILSLMADGRITSATVIANAPAVAAAAQALRSLPRCSFGAHLNLTQFAPLTGGPGAKLLTSEGDEMSRRNESLRRTTPALLRAAYEELAAQLQRLIALGVPVSHIDSHNHVHTRPQFFPVFKAIQRRFGIRRARLGKNVYAPEQPATAAMLWKKRAFNMAVRGVYPRATTTSAFTELLTYARVLELGFPRPSTIELMVHPGAPYADPEVALLQSDWFTAESRQCTWISYNDL